MNTRNYSLYYNVALTKVFRKSRTIFCRVYDKNEIYVSNGHFAFILNEYEYNRLIYPVTLRPAGNFKIEGERYEEMEFDFKKIQQGIEDYDDVLSLFPFSFHDTCGYYNSNLSFCCSTNNNYIVCLNELYVNAIKTEVMTIKGAGNKSPVGFYNSSNDLVAFILPINFDRYNVLAAVKAYYGIELNNQNKKRFAA